MDMCYPPVDGGVGYQQLGLREWPFRAHGRQLTNLQQLTELRPIAASWCAAQWADHGQVEPDRNGASRHARPLAPLAKPTRRVYKGQFWISGERFKCAAPSLLDLCWLHVPWRYRSLRTHGCVKYEFAITPLPETQNSRSSG